MDSGIKVWNVFDEYLSNGKVESSSTWKRIEQLESKLDGRRSQNQDLHERLADFFESGSSNAVINYVHLKEKLDSTIQEINTLEAKLKQLRINVAAEKNKLQLDIEHELKAHEEREMKKLQQLHEEIDNRKNQHKLTVEHLNNELQLVQVTIDLEQDEMETKLRRELIDLNSKIWRQQNIAKEVQIKIDDLERRQQAILRPPEFCATGLEQELQFFQLNQLDEVFQDAGYDCSDAQHQTIMKKTNVDNFAQNREPDIIENPPEEYRQPIVKTIRLETYNPNLTKNNQKQLKKLTRRNLKTSTLVPDDIEDKCYNVVYMPKEMVNNEFQLPKYPDFRRETTPDNQLNRHILKEINTPTNRAEGYCMARAKENLESNFSSISFIGKSDKDSCLSKSIENVKSPKRINQSDVNDEIIPKWTRKSIIRKSVTGASSLPKRTSSSSRYNALSAQKKCEPSNTIMFAHNSSMQTNETNVPKKRKLFNVNNLEYLEDLIELTE